VDSSSSSSESSSSSSESSSSSSESSSSSSSSESSSSSSSSSSSESSSSSSQSSSATPGTVVFGHDTAVDEDYAEDLSTWTGTGTVSGSGDAEILTQSVGDVDVSPTWNLGAGEAVILIDKYQSGSGPTPALIEYKTGVTKAAAEADTWTTYDNVSFTSLGWVKVRVTK
jgi:hypothetical protein